MMKIFDKIKMMCIMLLLVFCIPFMIACSMIDKMSGSGKVRLLQQKGEPAEAKILKIWETGITVNERPVVGFLLEVYPSDKQSYQATTKCIISILDIPQIQPGAIVGVHFDPAQPSVVSLDICMY